VDRAVDTCIIEELVDCEIVPMKSAMKLAILLLSFMVVIADERCQNLIQQCNMVRTTCNPSSVTINSCCDLTSFPLSVAPSNVYVIDFDCSDVCADNFATQHVYCDMHTVDGGWTVIQRNRVGSEVSFDRDWVDYEEGFGDLQKEFWYGLKKLHCLTRTGQWEMRVDIQHTADGPFSFLHFTNFSVGNTTAEYPLMIGGFTGTGTNPFAPHNNREFSTRDNDNDFLNANCAANSAAGWWYRGNCRGTDFNLNRPTPVFSGGLVFTEMKMRPKNCITA